MDVAIRKGGGGRSAFSWAVVQSELWDERLGGTNSVCLGVGLRLGSGM